LKKKPAHPQNHLLVLGLAVIIVLALVISALIVLRNPSGQNQPERPTVGYGPISQTLSPNSPEPSTAIATAFSNTPAPTLPPATATPASRPNLADRFGIIITGLDNLLPEERDNGLRHAIDTTGAQWWYQYNNTVPDYEKAKQVQLVRIWGNQSLAVIKANLTRQLSPVITREGTLYWMIGNEPNTPGQDNATPEFYAEAFKLAVDLIRTARPNDKIVGPNVLNWNYTCNGCPGYTAGEEWVDRFRLAYRTRNGGLEPPLDIWAIHTYSLDWNDLPLVNQPRDARQLVAFRDYLDKTPSEKAKPIWLTEFGVIWGYDRLNWEKDVRGNYQALPAGKFRQDQLLQYLVDSLDWLEENAERLNIGRWFIYTTFGVPEAFSNTFNGLALFEEVGENAPLSAFGKLYQSRIRRYLFP
jgi:hypothetical protein